jgi:hypothetical protein
VSSGKDVKRIKERISVEPSESENDNPFSFKRFAKKDAALKTGGRVLQVQCLIMYHTSIHL